MVVMITLFIEERLIEVQQNHTTFDYSFSWVNEISDDSVHMHLVMDDFLMH